MRNLRIAFLPFFALIVLSTIVLSTWASSQEASPRGAGSPGQDATSTQSSLPAPVPGSFDQVMDRVVEREHFFTAPMRHLNPLVETYIQKLKCDAETSTLLANVKALLRRL